MAAERGNRPSQRLPGGGEHSVGDNDKPRPDPDRETELAQIDAALRGDMEAFANLFGRYRPNLYALCRKRLNDPSLAEDIVQDVFIRAYINLPDSDYRKPIWPWLATIATRLCFNLNRNRSHIHFSEDIEEAANGDSSGGSYRNGTPLHPETGSALDAVIESERRNELFKSLEVLPKRQRRVLLLYALDGWSCADIAKAEGVSVGAVHLMLFRARRKMRAARESGPPVLVLFPFTWLRDRFRDMEEQLRMPFSFYGEKLTAAGAVASLGLAAILAATGNVSAEPPSGPPYASPSSFADPTPSGNLSRLFGDFSIEGLNRWGEHQDTAHSSDPATPGSLLNELMGPNPNEDATPEETSFWDVSVSPDYDNDHTIVGLGIYQTHAGQRSPVVFVSSDGGATWEPQASRLLSPGKLAIPPGFSKSKRIFAFSGYGLQESSDGGETFKLINPFGSTRIAISPLFGQGDQKILMAGSRNFFELDISTGLAEPVMLTAPLPRPYGSSYGDVAYSPDYLTDSTFLLAYDGRVFRCQELVCDSTVSSYRGMLKFEISDVCIDQGLSYGYSPYDLVVSRDASRTYEKVPFALQYEFPYYDARSVQDMTVLCSGEDRRAIFVAAHDYSTPHHRPRLPSGVFRSLDDGASWSRSWIDLQGFIVGSGLLTVTPTGRLLAAGVSSNLACSEDLGETWAPRCSPER